MRKGENRMVTPFEAGKVAQLITELLRLPDDQKPKIEVGGDDAPGKGGQEYRLIIRIPINDITRPIIERHGGRFGFP
jgi:hypothetical protein